MQNRRNYYRLLQVQPGAPVEIIRASYRTLMQRLKAHPDLGGSHRHAVLLNEAYAVLTDPDKRAGYDREFQARVIDTRGMAGGQPLATGVLRTRPRNDAAHCLFCHAPHPSRPSRQRDARCRACGSPLYPATAWRLATGDRRRVHRVLRNHTLRLFTSWPGTALIAYSRDLSPNGISFVTREQLAPQAIIKIDSKWCLAVARVASVHVDPSGTEGSWLVGAGFLSVIFPRSRGAFLSAEA